MQAGHGEDDGEEDFGKKERLIGKEGKKEKGRF